METLAAIGAGTAKVFATVGAKAAAVGSKVASSLGIGGQAAAAGSREAVLAEMVAANTARTAATAAGGASTFLKALRVGTSAVSALSVFQTAQAQARALEDDAANEEVQGRQEYIQAQEASNEIQRQFNQVVADQRAVAAANGIDVSSGSVAEARQDAQTVAERQLSITRSGADLNASLRRARAGRLRSNATTAREGGALAGAGKGLGVYLDLKAIG